MRICTASGTILRRTLSFNPMGEEVSTVCVLCVLYLYSYVLTGTQKGFDETFGSTCHGAVSDRPHSATKPLSIFFVLQGRALSRAKSR